MRFASALANVNEDKEGEKEKISHTLLHSHTARALCHASEIMREKRIEREGKRYGQRMKKIERKREKRRIRGIALLRILGFTS